MNLSKFTARRLMNDEYPSLLLTNFPVLHCV